MPQDFVGHNEANAGTAGRTKRTGATAIELLIATIALVYAAIAAFELFSKVERFLEGSRENSWLPLTLSAAVVALVLLFSRAHHYMRKRKNLRPNLYMSFVVPSFAVLAFVVPLKGCEIIYSEVFLFAPGISPQYVLIGLFCSLATGALIGAIWSYFFARSELQSSNNNNPLPVRAPLKTVLFGSAIGATIVFVCAWAFKVVGIFGYMILLWVFGASPVAVEFFHTVSTLQLGMASAILLIPIIPMVKRWRRS